MLTEELLLTSCRNFQLIFMLPFQQLGGAVHTTHMSKFFFGGCSICLEVNAFTGCIILWVCIIRCGYWLRTYWHIIDEWFLCFYWSVSMVDIADQTHRAVNRQTHLSNLWTCSSINLKYLGDGMRFPVVPAGNPWRMVLEHQGRDPEWIFRTASCHVKSK